MGWITFPGLGGKTVKNSTNARSIKERYCWTRKSSVPWLATHQRSPNKPNRVDIGWEPTTLRDTTREHTMTSHTKEASFPTYLGHARGNKYTRYLRLPLLLDSVFLLNPNPSRIGALRINPLRIWVLVVPRGTLTRKFQLPAISVCT